MLAILLHAALAGVISMTAMGFSVDDEALLEVSGATETANMLMSALFPSVLAAFKSRVDEISIPLLPFMSAYMARLKALHKR
jgi:exportin-T